MLSIIYRRDQKHVQWARAYLAILDEMKQYIMDFHTTGLIWNPKVHSVFVSSFGAF